VHLRESGCDPAGAVYPLRSYGAFLLDPPVMASSVKLWVTGLFKVLYERGSTIVNVTVHQNRVEGQKRESDFWSLQEDILQEYSLDDK
jgi:cytochrome c-type biogenesis protein CcmH/NrfF